MRALIFHGGARALTGLEAAHDHLCSALQAKGWEVESVRLEEKDIRPCTGCFSCWFRTPGECLQNDDGKEIARYLAQCEAYIFLTPISFGGYGSILKRGLDRMIPFISPLFKTIGGEIHHILRYPRAKYFFGIGWQEQADPESAAVFTQLVRRNAINMNNPPSASLVLTGAQATAEVQAAINGLVHQMEARA